jgi:hypothetical protein
MWEHAIRAFREDFTALAPSHAFPPFTQGPAQPTGPVE